MPKVEIAHDVYAALQRRAVPFEEDINDVLRRLLRGDRSTFRANADRLDEPPRGLHAVTVAGGSTADDERGTGSDGSPDECTVIVTRRAPIGDHLAQSTIRAAVLGVLKSTGKAITVADLFGHVERQLHGRMSAPDFEPLSSGLTQWQHQ